MSMSKDAKRKLALVVVSTLLTLVVAAVTLEAYLVIGHGKWKAEFEKNGDWYGGLTVASENPLLMWEYRPNMASSTPGLPVIRTNRYGFRDFDYESKTKPDSVYRISFIGDSVTLGYGVDGESTFVNKFSTYAGYLHPEQKIQALNFGIDGYNTVQIHELLRSNVIEFEPQLVVYVLCLNDFDFEESSGDKSKYFRRPKSFLCERIERGYRSYKNIEFHSWHFQKNREEVFQKILDMDKLLKQRGIDFQVALMPVFDHSQKDFNTYRLNGIHMEVLKLLKRNDMRAIDLLDLFRFRGVSPRSMGLDVWHPNEDGHDLIAKGLASAISVPKPKDDDTAAPSAQGGTGAARRK
jgi:lysophospholipase L1-like esterase